MSTVEVERVDGVTVARVTDDVDTANARAVHDRLAGALDSGADCMIVDLSATRYLDSAGLDMLLRLAERLSHRRVTLMLVIPTASQLTRLAAIVGLPQAVAVHVTLAGALEACARLPRATPPAEIAQGDNIP
jgi:anti-anti-sigma factor